MFLIQKAIVTTQTSYIPNGWGPASGGIQIFNASLASQAGSNAMTAGLVQYAFQDTTVSFPVDPVSSNCQSSGPSCKSYLIPSGPLTVSPWPYKILDDDSLSVFMTKGGPAYQVDVWDAPGDIKWDQGTCEVFGTTNWSAFKLCVSATSTDGNQLVAGNAVPSHPPKVHLTRLIC